MIIEMMLHHNKDSVGAEGLIVISSYSSLH